MFLVDVSIPILIVVPPQGEVEVLDMAVDMACIEWTLFHFTHAANRPPTRCMTRIEGIGE